MAAEIWAVRGVVSMTDGDCSRCEEIRGRRLPWLQRRQVYHSEVMYIGCAHGAVTAISSGLAYSSGRGDSPLPSPAVF